jgi:hypothetical protein
MVECSGQTTSQSRTIAPLVPWAAISPIRGREVGAENRRLNLRTERVARAGPAAAPAIDL